MSDVRRYRLTNARSLPMEKHIDGEWTPYSDAAAALAAERTRAEAAESKLEETLFKLASLQLSEGTLRAERDALAARLAAMEAALAEAPVVEVMEVGNDDTGQPRVLCHGTIEELRKGAALVYRRIRLVRDAAIAHAPGADNREESK